MAARVLIVGGGARPLADQLSRRGFTCDAHEQFPSVDEVLDGRAADAIVVSGTSRAAADWVTRLRGRKGAAHLPVVLGGRAARSSTLKRLDVDGVALSIEDLERQLTAGMRARRQAERETLERRRLELLLDISRTVANGVGLDELLAQVSSRLEDVASCEEVSLLVLGGPGSRSASLVGPSTRTPIELGLAPTLLRALETKAPVALEGGWAFPFHAQTSSGVAALVVRRPRPFEQAEIDLLEAVGFALGQAAERERAKAAQLEAQRSLEAAYVDRYNELLAANERLKAVDRKKNELLAVLTHDLRAPLNVLLGHSHLLVTDPGLGSANRASAEAIQRTSRKVLDLVESLLAQARAEKTPVALFTRAFDVAETCQDSVKDLQILAGQRGVTLRVEAPQSLPTLGDEQKIRQVLQNLVTNALSHAKRVKTVTVRAQHRRRPDGDVALVEVADDGLVIDATEFLLAFERSQGLGLAICREYVDRHGGEIWADVNPGGGGVLAFTLPLQQEPRADTGDLAAVDRPRVLLAEPDADFARACAAALSGHYLVDAVDDGEAALVHARRARPDLVVMDVFMPKRDGLEVLRVLRASPETASVPVLLTASNAQVAEKLDPLAIGASELLCRPFPTSLLLNRVGQELKRVRPRIGHAVPGNDPDTGLFDHLGLANRIEQERSRGRRSGHVVTVGVLKPEVRVTDRLREAAVTIRARLEVPDVVGHLGDGVFCVIIPEAAPDQAEALLTRLVEALDAVGLPYRRAVKAIDAADARPTDRLLEGLLS